MSLYADYLQERTNDRIVETPYGFATYRYINDGKSVYIIDIYMVPEHRKKYGASDLADIIAEEAKLKGCTEMIGTVSLAAKNSKISLRVLFGYGFEMLSANNDVIILRKDL